MILVVKRINAHGEDGEKEEWRQGMEVRENFFETFMPHDESIYDEVAVVAQETSVRFSLKLLTQHAHEAPLRI